MGLIRASFIITLLALAGAGYFTFELQTTLEDTKSQRDYALEAQQQAEADQREAKKLQEEAETERDQFQTQAQTRLNELKQARKQYQEQLGRNNEQFQQLQAMTAERNQARQELSRWTGFGKTIEQIEELIEREKTVRVERDQFIAENKVLLNKINKLDVELSRYTGSRAKVILPSNLKGSVLAVDPKYDFVVLDVGREDGVLEHGELLVNREQKLVGKLRILSVEAQRSIANVLPEWRQDDVKQGDQVLVGY